MHIILEWTIKNSCSISVALAKLEPPQAIKIQQRENRDISNRIVEQLCALIREALRSEPRNWPELAWRQCRQRCAMAVLKGALTKPWSNETSWQLAGLTVKYEYFANTEWISSHGGGQWWLCWTYRTGRRRVTLVLRGSLRMGRLFGCQVVLERQRCKSWMCKYQQQLSRISNAFPPWHMGLVSWLERSGRSGAE